MRLLFLPKYALNGASSRYRTYQYLEYFNSESYRVEPLFDEKYITYLYAKQSISKLYVLKRYIKRVLVLLQAHKYDVVFLEKEFFPYLPFCVFLLKVLKINYVVDYDDAIFHSYDSHKLKLVRQLFKHKIPSVIQNATAVIVGSPYLKEFAQKYNSAVYEISTSIDIERYTLKIQKSIANNDILKIGWIGSPTTSKHLSVVIDALLCLVEQQIAFELVLIGFSKQSGIDFKAIPVNYVKWSSETEVEELHKIDVGIMPLLDDAFAHGKCAFKLIQYMACGIPTIATPFKSNLKVDRNKENLFASTTEEWVDSFIKVLKNRVHYKAVGKRNKTVITNMYSKQANKTKYKAIFEQAKCKNIT